MKGKMRRFAVVLLLILLLVLWASVMVASASMVWSG
jgi:Na+-transporting NADH:ubiquinone oxidoreductase subunit NqrC